MAGRAAWRWVRVVVRAAIPLVLLSASIVSLVYGVSRHTAVVSFEQEIEIDLAPPPGFHPHGDPFGGPGGGGMPGDGFGPPGMGGPPPWMGPPPEMTKVKQKVTFNETTTEPTLIREITFGGVTRLSSGVLWRTYTGTPPSLCPT